jgi:hypothetical protein
MPMTPSPPRAHHWHTMKLMNKICANLACALLLVTGAAASHAAGLPRPAQAAPDARAAAAVPPTAARPARIKRPATRQLQLAPPAPPRAESATPVAASEEASGDAGEKPDDLQPQRLFGNFKREGLPFAVLAESRSFRVAAGISPRKVAGIYFVRKAGTEP